MWRERENIIHHHSKLWYKSQNHNKYLSKKRKSNKFIYFVSRTDNFHNEIQWMCSKHTSTIQDNMMEKIGDGRMAKLLMLHTIRIQNYDYYQFRIPGKFTQFQVEWKKFSVRESERGEVMRWVCRSPDCFLITIINPQWSTHLHTSRNCHTFAENLMQMSRTHRVTKCCLSQQSCRVMCILDICNRNGGIIYTIVYHSINTYCDAVFCQNLEGCE